MGAGGLRLMTGEVAFFGEQLPAEVEAFLFDTNPWWQGKAMRPLPPYRRWLFPEVLKNLKAGVAPVTALRGSRQVGKTTLLEQVIAHLLQVEGVAPRRIFRLQFDEIPSLRMRDPILAVTRWYERRILNESFNESAAGGQPAFLFFDEVQNLADWAPQVKSLVDHHAVRILLTGSSALRIELGRDSLAGRITTLEMGTFLLREICGVRRLAEIPPLTRSNSLSHLKEFEFWQSLRDHGRRFREARDAAFLAFSERGGYPVAQTRADLPWEQIAAHLNETIIQRVIQHDLRVGEHGRKRDQTLLEEIFRLACRYAGQAPGQALLLEELRSSLHANIGRTRLDAYLRFLNNTLLIRLVEPLEIRLKRRKGYAKICLCDHGLRASWLQEIVPVDPEGLRRAPHLSDLAGRIAESIAGYFLGTIPGLNLRHFPARPMEPEVDFVITVGEWRIPMEIKYRQRIDPRKDTLGLQAFLDKEVYRAPFGILVTLTDDAVRDPRIVSLPLSSLLLMR